MLEEKYKVAWAAPSLKRWKVFESQTLVSVSLASHLGENVSEVDVAKGRPKHQQKTMYSSKFVAGKDSNPSPRRRKKSTEIVRQKKDIAGPSTNPTLRNRSVHNKQKVIKANRSVQAELTVQILQLCRLANNTTMFQKVYLSLFVCLTSCANVEKEWLENVRGNLYFCSDSTFDKYDAVSSFLKAAMISWGHLSYVLYRKAMCCPFVGWFGCPGVQWC